MMPLLKSKKVTGAANTYLKKMCFKKCKTCRGAKCPNFFGVLGNKGAYYGEVLHSKKITFSDDISKQKPPMDKFDWQLVYGFIALCIFLTIFGNLLP